MTETDGTDWLFEGAIAAGGPLTVGQPVASAHADLQVLACVGAGGMGVVYRVETPDGPRAVKVLAPALKDDATARVRFEREQDFLQRLVHQDIVRWYRGGLTDDGLPFFVMDWVQGTRLDQLPRGTPLDVQVWIIRLLADTLTYLHAQQVLHRDVKGSNVIIAAETGRPILCDFGIARDLGAPAGTLTAGGRAGTAGYVPHTGEATPQRDVYALGGLFIEMYAGQPPSAGYPPPSRFGFPAAVNIVVAKAVEQDAARRYSTPLAFAEALENALLDARQDQPTTIPDRVSPGEEDEQVTSTASLRDPLATQPSDGPRPPRFGPPALVAEARSLLRSVSAPGLDPMERVSGLDAALSLKAECVAERDASHPTGNPPPRALPQLLSFSPLGDALATACGAWGCTHWSWNGRRLERRWTDHPWSCYGEALGFFWSDRGAHLMMTTMSNRWSYLEFFDAAAGHFDDQPGRSVGTDIGFWMDRAGGRDHGVRFFQPWRPGTSSVLLRTDYNTLSLVDPDKLPTRATGADSKGSGAPSLIRNLFRFAIGSAVDSSKKEEGSPIERATIHSLSLQLFGAAHAMVEALHWHPSGQFIAVSSSSTAGLFSTRVIHFDSGVVVDTLPNCRAIAWSQRGGELLVEPNEAESNGKPSCSIWSVSTGSLAPCGQSQRRSREFSAYIASLDENAPCNASGELKLTREIEGLVVGRVSDGRALATVPAGRMAVWSPTDPQVFATIGGTEAPEALRLWRLST
jgi:serine/threonine protein kinase